MPAGQFILEWQGEGTLETYQPYTVIGPNRILIDFAADYTGPGGAPQDDGITIILSETDPSGTGDYIRDIKLYRADNADLIAAGEHFDPAWMDRIDDFRVLRTHDWQSTNFPSTVDWSRNVYSADQALWGQPGRGMPYELLVEVAKQTRSDLWVNIPHTASDADIRAAAAYIRDNLDPGLMVQMEFSNEYFTTIFDQYQFFQSGGAQAFPGAPFEPAQFYGTQAARMAAIADAAFGAGAQRLKMVVAVDNLAFNTAEAELILTVPASTGQDGASPLRAGIDVLATDGYLGWYAPSITPLMRSWMQDGDGGFGRARDYLLDQLQSELLPSWQKGRALADMYGLEFVVYEGGALLLNDNDFASADPVLTDFATRFAGSAEMREVCEAEIAAWQSVGTGPFAWYADVGRPGPWGYYGHWDSVTYAPSPRAEAIEAANGTGPWWPGDSRPASTFDNGRYWAGTQGADRAAGTALRDRLYGIDGNDLLLGLAGDDRLWGGAGNDILAGCAGRDELNGGAGVDLADYARSAAGVMVNLTTGRGSGGAAQGDTLTGVERLRGSNSADRLTGDAGGNALYGRGGNDRLLGLAGADTLRGDAGNDSLTGGGGADVMTGGTGADTFIFARPAHGGDRITDFHGVLAGGGDRLLLAGAGFGGHAAGALTAAEFQSGLTASAATAAVRIVYDRDDHAIWYDPDGSGPAAPVLLAQLQAGAQVTEADFAFY